MQKYYSDPVFDRLHAGSIAEAMKLKSTMIARKMAQALAIGGNPFDLSDGVQVYPSDNP